MGLANCRHSACICGFGHPYGLDYMCLKVGVVAALGVTPVHSIPIIPCCSHPIVPDFMPLALHAIFSSTIHLECFLSLSSTYDSRVSLFNTSRSLHTMIPPSTQNTFLIWSGNGWVASHLASLLKDHSKTVHTTTVRMENREAVIAELDRVKPTHVMNCAGCTGRPNVDWCEDNKAATIRSNDIGTLNLADACEQRGIHISVFATGCIYAYDDSHPIGRPGFKETDPANFSGSFYSATKSKVEEVRILISTLRNAVADNGNKS